MGTVMVPLALNDPKNSSMDFSMEVSINGGTPKSSILMGCSLINYPFLGTPCMETSTKSDVGNGDMAACSSPSPKKSVKSVLQTNIWGCCAAAKPSIPVLKNNDYCGIGGMYLSTCLSCSGCVS